MQASFPGEVCEFSLAPGRVTRPRFVSFREFVKIRDPVQARRGYGRTICVGDSVSMAARLISWFLSLSTVIIASPTVILSSPSSDSRASNTRPITRTDEHSGWLAALSGAERSWFREQGTRLVGDLLAHLDAGRGEAAALLTSAERRAGEYGAESARLGASLSDTVEGFLRFRKPFVDELAILARRRRLDTREATTLLADAESALDRLLVALMIGHGAKVKMQ